MDAQGGRQSSENHDGWTTEAARELVRQRISNEAVFRNIANTAKHGSYRSEDLEDIHARMTPHYSDWEAPNWRLTYHTSGVKSASLDAGTLFGVARKEWADLLLDYDWLD